MNHKILAMFPGQGSQFVGMGKNLVSEFPYTKDVFRQASEAISIDMEKLCFEGPESALALTENTQPCILTVSYAVWQVLDKETGLKPEIFAGHSLGEYSALVASQKLAFADGIRLVRARGQAMQKAVPVGAGKMLAVLNCEAPQLESLCAQSSAAGNSVEVVNYNSPKQLVVAGHVQAVEKLETTLGEARVKFIALNVSAPFHSRLMSPARDAMRSKLEATKLQQNANRVIPNLTAKISSDYSVNLLIEQIDHPVLWMQSLAEAEKSGCDFYLEVGPGKVLAGLGKRTLTGAENKYVDTTDIRAAIGAILGSC